MTVLAEDTFTDTNGVTLSTHVPTGTTPGTAYVNYGSLGGNRVIINNNRVNHNSAGGNDAACLLDKTTAYPNDYEVSADLVFLTNSVTDLIAVLARGNSVDFACYRFGWHSDGNWKLYRVNAAASLLQLGSSVAFAFSAVTKTVKLKVSSTSIEAFVDGVSTIGPITNSDVTTGRPGLWLNAGTAQIGTTGIVLDNLSVSDVVSASVAPPRDLQHTPQHQSFIAQ